MSYRIVLPQFEGPFDLLLFFIERDELDIYNIPIAKLTNDFLEYIRHLESLNLDVASEFILVASTLMNIKSKMLLPRREVNEGGEEIDPREELVQRLLEYKRYKSVLSELHDLEAQQLQRQHRGNLGEELQQQAQQALAEAEWEALSLFKLLKAYERVLERFERRENQVVHKVLRYNYTLEGQRDYILSTVKLYAHCDFERLFEPCENRIHAIFTFLALLELIQQESVQLVQVDGLNAFELKASA